LVVKSFSWGRFFCLFVYLAVKGGAVLADVLVKLGVDFVVSKDLVFDKLKTSLKALELL
jgi:hypothetical protein